MSEQPAAPVRTSRAYHGAVTAGRASASSRPRPAPPSTGAAGRGGCLSYQPAVAPSARALRCRRAPCPTSAESRRPLRRPVPPGGPAASRPYRRQRHRAGTLPDHRARHPARRADRRARPAAGRRGPIGSVRPARAARGRLLQAVTAAGWFRLNGMWPARQGIALAFLGGLATDVGPAADRRENAPAAIIGTLGVWCCSRSCSSCATTPAPTSGCTP